MTDIYFCGGGQIFVYLMAYMFPRGLSVWRVAQQFIVKAR